jgi:hypothetical protein
MYFMSYLMHIHLRLEFKWYNTEKYISILEKMVNKSNEINSNATEQQQQQSIYIAEKYKHSCLFLYLPPKAIAP